MKITDSWDEALGRTISIDGKLIKEVQSKYQNIKVYDTKSFGKLLQLDGVIQLTEFDEANYHEMFAHVESHDSSSNPSDFGYVLHCPDIFICGVI